MQYEDLTEVGRRGVGVAALLFAAIFVLIGIDIASDYRAGTELLHVATELAVMAAALVGAVALWWMLRAAQRRAEALTVDLAAAREEARRFSEDARDALQGLGEAIDRQFQRWELTTAEREVGLLMLKGLSHREIAALRQTTEVTVRQQALAVYRKAGLRGRSELSAFFLEDLLVPSVPQP